MVVHIGEGSLHVAHEPSNGMLGHPLPAPRGRFCRVCSHVIVPGTNPWSSPAHGHLSLVCEDQSLPGRVSGSFFAHALSPGLALISWEACPVTAWAFFATSTAAQLACFPSGFRAVSFYLYVPGTFSIAWLFWRGMSDICRRSRGCM